MLNVVQFIGFAVNIDSISGQKVSLTYRNFEFGGKTFTKYLSQARLANIEVLLEDSSGEVELSNETQLRCFDIFDDKLCIYSAKTLQSGFDGWVPSVLDESYALPILNADEDRLLGWYAISEDARHEVAELLNEDIDNSSIREQMLLLDKPLDLVPLYCYNQYNSVEVLKKLFSFVSEYLVAEYLEQLPNYWDSVDIKNSNSKFLTYYTREYLGLHRPLTGASLGEYYDSGLTYDSKINGNTAIYDDSQMSDGLITNDQYLKYIKFIYDYSQESWTIDYIVRFICDFCGDITPLEVELDYSELRYVMIYIPQTNSALDFVKMWTLEYDNMCLPYPKIVDIRVKSGEGDGTDRRLETFLAKEGSSWIDAKTTREVVDRGLELIL